MNRDKWPSGSRADLMNGLCNHFLAGAGFSLDEDRGLGRGHEFHPINHRLQLVGITNDVVEVEFLIQPFVQLLNLHFERLRF